MDFIIKRRLSIFILFALALFYFSLRLPNLTLQPIFADEAIYIRWAQVMKAESTLRFLPLSDGKTPLFMWVLMPLLKIVKDPLLAGRLLSVIAGFFTFLGVFFLSKKIFNTRTAFWAGLLYVITPYTLFFDRMALVDSMLAAFTVWVVYFALWLVRSLRLDIAMILGFLLAGAFLTKTPGMVNIYLLPALGFCFKREKGGKYALIKLLVLFGVAVMLALSLYNILRLGPNFHMLSLRNSDYIFSPFELIGRPLDPFIPHFHDISDWFPKLLTWPVLLSASIGVIYIISGIFSKPLKGIQTGLMSKERLIILAWAAIPLLISMAILKTFTARYLLSSIPLILIIAGYGVTKLLPPLAYIKKWPILLMLVVLLPLPIYFDYYLLSSPGQAPLPKAERRGYFEEWTAGYGFADIASFLVEKSQNNKVVLGTEGFFGTLPDGVQIYLDKANIPIIGSKATISAQIRNAAKDNLTFFVGNKNRVAGAIDGVELVHEYPKAKPMDGSPADAIVLYRVLP